MSWSVGTLAVLAGLFFWGSADASRDEFLTRLFLAFAAVGTIPFVFAWKFIGVPSRMQKGLRDWVKELEGAIIESRQTDAVILGMAERYNEGSRLYEGRAGDDELRAWEVGFDAYVKENFGASFFLQLCGPPPPAETYKRDGWTTTISAAPSYRERLGAKLHRICNLLPYADAHYRGRTFNSLDFQHSLIRQYGLPEHRSPQGTE